MYFSSIGISGDFFCHNQSALYDVKDNERNDVTITYIMHVNYHYYMTWLYAIEKQVDGVISYTLYPFIYLHRMIYCSVIEL